MAGIMHRVTPDHYNLYNEEETLVGALHHVSRPDSTTGEGHFWYGTHVTGRSTPLHTNRFHAAQDLMEMPGDIDK